jgi:hypothetical protein
MAGKIGQKWVKNFLVLDQADGIAFIFDIHFFNNYIHCRSFNRKIKDGKLMIYDFLRFLAFLSRYQGHFLFNVPV